MSGICGVWQQSGAESLAGVVASVAQGLSVDPSERIQTLIAGNAGVAVAARFGTQQIFGNSRIRIACDADLTNEEELRRLLIPDAAPSGTGTAALLAALYERFGPEFVNRVYGGLSFVLWDARNRTLIAGVDAFGINRLAFYEGDGRALVSTRVDALARSGAVDVEINPRAIANILNFSANLAPATILARVQRLLPGTILTVSEGRISQTKYWKPRYGVHTGSREQELARRLYEVVKRSVAAQAKVPPAEQCGAFLSGGTDSSTVVGMLTRLGLQPVRSFSIGFQEEAYNELEYAQTTADWFKTEHYTYLVSADDCFEALSGMVRAFDEPYGNSSAIPTYFCARLAAQHGTKWLLAGDGGDELFGGNERYRTDKLFDLYQRIPRLLRAGFIEPFLAAVPLQNGLPGKARRYVRRSNIPRLDRFFSYNLLCAHNPAEVFAPGFLASLAEYSVLETPRMHYDSADASDGLDRLLYLDLNITLADNDLPKVTRMCELAGVQVRFPFLDRSVVEFSGCIPPVLKVKGLEKRYLFKQAFRQLLPPAVIQKKKHGFGLPVAFWLKTDPRLRELAIDVLTSRCSRERGYFNRGFVENLFRSNELEESPYYGDMLWIFLTLELWQRQLSESTAKVTA